MPPRHHAPPALPGARPRRPGAPARAVLALAALGAAAPGAGAGEVTGRDLQVVARAVAFLSAKPQGAVRAAVVYDPASPASRADAERIAGQLAGASGGGVTLTGGAVAAGADLGGARVVVFAAGTAGVQARVAGAAGGALTVSNDPACARAGHCVLAVQAQPRVEILLNRGAAARARLSFEQSFTLLIKEI